MVIERLQQLAEDFNSVPPSEFGQLAASCDEAALNNRDVRFVMLGQCLALTYSFWGVIEDDDPPVDADFYDRLGAIWMRHLPGILQAAGEEEGVALARTLHDDLAALGAEGPLRQRRNPGS